MMIMSKNLKEESGGGREGKKRKDEMEKMETGTHRERARNKT